MVVSETELVSGPCAGRRWVRSWNRPPLVKDFGDGLSSNFAGREGADDWLMSPVEGEIGSVNAFAITAENVADVAARETLLDRAMGQAQAQIVGEAAPRPQAVGRAGLCGARRGWAHGRHGPAVGRGRRFVAPPLLLGPLAVDPALKNAGIGAALMRHAIAEARRLGHRAILLVGDAPYYGRFGFSAEKTGSLAMPGPYERHRLLALELQQGALDGACGVITAAGRRLEPRRFVGANVFGDVVAM